ncbi:MAG: aminotransferase class IV, partial [Gammaproteobacteria bacterium]|nr:aminotransferase class IV [Gammaproteobacteria bacterium]
NGELLTPPSTASILTGITRDSVKKLAARMGINVREQSIPRELLYLADEIFFTGTAAEITPVRSVDRIEIGDGKRGPLTEQLQQAFFGLFGGLTEDSDGWLEGLAAAPAASAARA